MARTGSYWAAASVGGLIVTICCSSDSARNLSMKARDAIGDDALSSCRTTSTARCHNHDVELGRFPLSCTESQTEASRLAWLDVEVIGIGACADTIGTDAYEAVPFGDEFERWVLRLQLEVIARELKIHGQPVAGLEFDNEWLSSCVALQGAVVNVGIAHAPRCHRVGAAHYRQTRQRTPEREREPRHM